MSIIRQDPTTKERLILATENVKRSHDFQKPISENNRQNLFATVFGAR
jgi:hypothetical protein